jgi:hypothetical protein
VSLIPTHGEVYSIQYYVIKFVSDLWQIGGFPQVLPFPPPIKLTPRYHRNIVERGVTVYFNDCVLITLYLWRIIVVDCPFILNQCFLVFLVVAFVLLS